MPASSTLAFVSTVALLAQCLIFLYLYASHPFRFFRYFLWAWGCFALWQASSLAQQFSPAAAGLSPLINAVGVVGYLLVLAAGLAFRGDYRLRSHHVALGGALAVAAPLLGAPVLGLVRGLALAAGGLAFWPRRGQRSPRGARVLASSLALWGMHRILAPFVAAPPGSAALGALNVTFILVYFLAVFGIIIVVLERARGEVEALKELNERLVEGLGEGLELVDGHYTVRHANRWMTGAFGPVAGRRCYEVLTADGKICPGCPLPHRADLTAPVHLDIAGRGERRLRLTCSPVRQPDGEMYLLELVADVTEPEQMRARLSEAERLASVGELAAGVAHEIRNPLSAILNASKLLDKEAPLTAEERADTLGALRQEARRLNATLSDFLTFARPREPNRLPGAVGDVVSHVAALLQRERATDLKVEVQVDPSVPTVAFDRDQLAQVIWNLALNGVEAMEGHGHLSFNVSSNDREVHIAISDTGPGIEPEDHARIFEPFVSRRPGGTGLGLAIARRIVNAHGGRIACESSPGRGSCFTVALPLKE